MLARFVLGVVAAGAALMPALAEQMGPEQARQFVAGKLFAFTCFDGSRGAGRIMNDGSVVGSIQFSGQGPTRFAHLPPNTIRVSSSAVCASLKGIPFTPCFNLEKSSERSFRGSVSGMGFAYCDFRHQGVGHMLMARAISRPRSLRAPETSRSADASHTEVSSRVETPRVEVGKIEPVKSSGPGKTEAAKAETAKSDSAPELRRSTD